MRAPSLPRSSWIVLTLLAAVMLPAPALAQSGLDSSEAEAFMGEWQVALNTEMGAFTMHLDITDMDGKVAVNIGSPEMGGMQEVSNVTMQDAKLMMSYDVDAQGQFVDVNVALEPDGEDLAFELNAAGGQFFTSGKATRRTP